MFSFLYFGCKLQDSSSLVMREFVYFHDVTFYVVLSVSFVVGMMLLFLWVNEFTSLVYLENKMLEMGWTLLPAFVLVLLALPSLKLLFYVEAPTSVSPLHTVKVIGHQWYWSFDSKILGKSVNRDIYMTPTDSLSVGGFRSLEVDITIPMYVYKYTRVIATAVDVLHSFALPALGLKIDAVPGRLNQQCVFPNTVGEFYGQCSEICGANHSFMPISVVISPK